jgi:hypothetical protein
MCFFRQDDPTQLDFSIGSKGVGQIPTPFSSLEFRLKTSDRKITPVELRVKKLTFLGNEKVPEKKKRSAVLN